MAEKPSTAETLTALMFANYSPAEITAFNDLAATLPPYRSNSGAIPPDVNNEFLAEFPVHWVIAGMEM